LGIAIRAAAFALLVAAGLPFAAPAQTDTTPPTGTIASPSFGATVSGTISVTASASDNVGVIGVQLTPVTEGPDRVARMARGAPANLIERGRVRVAAVAAAGATCWTR
jgi:Big-like domain-containing protein